MDRAHFTILTKAPGFHPFSFEWLRYYIKKVIGKKRGPDAVVRSLVCGLKENNIIFNINPIFHSRVHAQVIVLSGFDALRYAINQKKNGVISKLYAGPNISVSPKDHDAILENEYIDKVIVNSDWVKQYYSTVSPSIKNKLIVWPCGIEIPQNLEEQNEKRVLVFKKNVSEEVYQEVQNVLDSKKVSYNVIMYGAFSQQEYFNMLKRTSVLIYLQNSESQGLAMFEAWARNVPTINYEHGIYTDSKGVTIEGAISAPYITKEVGLSFNKGNFEQVWNTYEQSKNSLTPKSYVRQNFSDSTCALNLINQLT